MRRQTNFNLVALQFIPIYTVVTTGHLESLGSMTLPGRQRD